MEFLKSRVYCTENVKNMQISPDNKGVRELVKNGQKWLKFGQLS